MHDSKAFWRAGLGCVALGVLVSGLSAWGRAQFAPNKRTNEIAAINLLGGRLPVAQSRFREGDLEGDGDYDYARNLLELIDAGLLPPELADGRTNGYRIELRQGNAPEFTWIAVASPTSPGVTGDSYFGVNQAGTVAYRDERPFPLAPNAALPADALRICGCNKHGKD